MFSFAKSCYKQALPCTSDKFFEIVKSREVGSTCEVVSRLKFRAADLRTQAEQLEREGQQKMAREKRLEACKREDEAAYLKRQLPVFCFQATFDAGRRTAACARPNGLVMMDFDHVADIEAFKQRLIEQKTVYDRTVLAAVTPSGKGFRLVVKASGLRSYAEEQDDIATALGYPSDPACKDMARCSFAFPNKNIFLISDSLFKYDNPIFKNDGTLISRNLRTNYTNSETSFAANTTIPNTAGNGSLVVDKKGRNPADTPDPAAGAVDSSIVGLTERQDTQQRLPDGRLAYRGVPIANIVSAWWRETGGEPVPGERNSRLQRLATNLRYILDNRADLLLEAMPRYGLSEAEMHSIIESSCRYAQMNYFPRTLRTVLQGLGIDGRSATAARIARPVQDGRLLDDHELDYWSERLDDIDLPAGLHETLACVPTRLRMSALVCCLPALYSLATGVQFRGWDNQRQRLSITSCLIGAAASGKSFARPLVSAWVAPIRLADRASREIENSYKREREANQGKKELQKRPEVVIREVPSTVSLASLFERSANARRIIESDGMAPSYSIHTHLYTEEWEFAAVARNMKKDFSNYADLLIKSHHDEKVGVDYRNDASANGIRNMHWNQMYAGNMVDFWKLFPDSQILNGMPTRVLLGYVPEREYEMNSEPVVLTVATRSVISKLAYKLDAMNAMVFVPGLNSFMFDCCKKKAEWARSERNKVADIIRRRAYSTIGTRAGVLSALLRSADNWDKLEQAVTVETQQLPREEQEVVRVLPTTTDDLKFARLVGDYAFEMQYKLFSIKMQRALDIQQEINQGVVVRNARREIVEKYKLLPETFTLDNVVEKFDLKKSSASSTCSRWVQEGFVERIGNARSGKYRKIKQSIL